MNYLRPGQETTVQVRFQTSETPGRQRHYLTLMADDPNAESKVFQITGLVQPRLYVEPIFHLVPPDVSRKGARFQSKLKNAVSDPITVKAVSATGPGIRVRTGFRPDHRVGLRTRHGNGVRTASRTNP